MGDSVSIIMCTERGVLENMSKILIESIRKFGGSLKDVPIYSFQPRKGHKVCKETKQFFELHDVEFIDIELNNKYSYYPLANKPMVCSWAEQHIDSETLVFLDSDVVIFDEPSLFSKVEDGKIRMSPVDIKGIGIGKDQNENSEYWQSLYETVGAQIKQFIETRVDGEEILAYWNTGHIIINKASGIFQKWKSNFDQVMRDKKLTSNGLFFIEQSTFSATVSASNLEIDPLHASYNYPIHLHPDLEQNGKGLNLETSVSWHYHDLFSSHEKPEYLESFLTREERGIWLSDMVKKYPLEQKLTSRIRQRAERYKNGIQYKLAGLKISS
ncbi:MAG: hypothetical protein JXQ96_23435 [Cyclobacteriaceae bacterium]